MHVTLAADGQRGLKARRDGFDVAVVDAPGRGGVDLIPAPRSARGDRLVTGFATVDTAIAAQAGAFAFRPPSFRPR